MTDWICERLSAEHEVAEFNCGKPSLDSWLRDQALSAGGNDLSRTYVCHAGDGRILAYFALVPHTLDRADMSTAKLRRNMPTKIPAVLLGKLAVDGSIQGRGYGRDVLIAAMERAVAISEMGGGRYLVVDALDENALAFYARYDFQPISSTSPLRLAVLIQDVRRTLELRE